MRNIIAATEAAIAAMGKILDDLFILILSRRIYVRFYPAKNYGSVFPHDSVLGQAPFKFFYFYQLGRE